MNPCISGRLMSNCIPIQEPKEKPATQSLLIHRQGTQHSPVRLTSTSPRDKPLSVDCQKTSIWPDNQSQVLWSCP